MKIKPSKGILIIKKHKNTAYETDIIAVEEEDKRLITGEVVAGEAYSVGSTVVFGKYALFPLTIKGEDFFFLEERDVIGTCDYKE